MHILRKLCIFLLLCMLYTNVSSAITIDNPNQVFNSTSFSTTFLSNQTYFSLYLGANYINLSNDGANYIIYSLPLLVGSQIRIPYTITGAFFTPSTFTATANINSANVSMTATATYLYYNATGSGSYVITYFNIIDNIGEKKILLDSPLVLNVAASPEIILVTNPASDVRTNGALLSGTIGGLPGSIPAFIWFEYGGNPSTFLLKTTTEATDINATFTKSITNSMLMAHTNYYYRARATYNGTEYYGNVRSFTTLSLSEIPDYSFDAYFNDLAISNLSISNLTRIGAVTYTNIFGSMFWGILFAALFIMLWISQGDVTIPALLGLIIGGSIWYLMPPEWVSIGMSLSVVSFAGIMYSLIKGRG